VKCSLTGLDSGCCGSYSALIASRTRCVTSMRGASRSVSAPQTLTARPSVLQRATLILALMLSGCTHAPQTAPAEPVCLTVVSPFVEDPIIIPPSLGDNVQLCAPKLDLGHVTEECVSLFAVRRYLYTHAAQRAER